MLKPLLAALVIGCFFKIRKKPDTHSASLLNDAKRLHKQGAVI